MKDIFKSALKEFAEFLLKNKTPDELNAFMIVTASLATLTLVGIATVVKNIVKGVKAVKSGIKKLLQKCGILEKKNAPNQIEIN